MCGIAGQISVSSYEPSIEVVQAMCVQIAHRGPDSAGVWTSLDRKVVLGHRRLAVIDLSPGGAQPMLSADGRIAVSFNGEIYNYRELREKLRKSGHVFHSDSDTEVIISAYLEWGQNFVDHLDGMFALALVDQTTGYVHLARDRAGEKPLFYAERSGRIDFASEVKALLVSNQDRRAISKESLNEYLAFGYVQRDRTLWSGIKKLPPASIASVNTQTGEVTQRVYWSLPRASVNSFPKGEATARLKDLLLESVSRQLVADVPVGVLLSGGLDSSIIAALAAEVSSERPNTYTARFTEFPEFDEGPFAKAVASHIGSHHSELEIPAVSKDILAQLARQFDDPIADSSMIPTFQICQEIRKFATVALGGDGGDELFGGYRRYPAMVRLEQVRSIIPSAFRSILPFLYSVLPQAVPGRGTLNGLKGDFGRSIGFAGLIFRHDERQVVSPITSEFSTHELLAPENTRAALANEALGIVQSATRADFMTYLVDDVLVKVDRASMLTSLEVRAPFLSKAVIEFCFSLEDGFRVTSKDRKILLRQLGKMLLPPSLDLTRKQGFSIPIEDWCRGVWADMVADIEALPSIIVSRRAFSDLTRRVQRGERVGDRLYSLLLLKLWEQEYQVTDVHQ